MSVADDTALTAVLAEIVQSQAALTPRAAALRLALRRSQSIDARKTLHAQLTEVERRLRLLAQARAATRALLTDGFPYPHTTGGPIL